MLISQTRGFAGEKDKTRVIRNDGETRFTALADSRDAAYWVDFRLDAPIADTYVMIPGCAYNGNRFQTVMRCYPPMYTEEEFGADVPVRMTEVPALAPEGDSFMDVTTGDMALPCVCVLRKSEKRAFMLFFEQGQHGLNHGVTLEQTGDELLIRLRAPAKRRLVYHWYDGYPSLREQPGADPPLEVRAGEETVITHRVFTFDCEDIPALFRAFFEKRSMLYRAGAHANLPFSRFWELAEAEQNGTHFDEKEGYYALQPVGSHPSWFAKWQAGWAGGGMLTLALLCEGGELSRRRVVRALRFCARWQSRAGWYYGIVADGEIHHDCFTHYEGKYNMLLVRKHADLTYFVFRQIEAMRRLGMEVPEEILHSAVMAANALKGMWERYGQIGQFVNAETGEILVGGTACGAVTPAALCAAAAVTGDESFLACARQVGDYYDRTALRVGYSTGGPGEILAAPDSESCIGLVEGFTVLYESDGSGRWLECAKEAAHMLSSWVVGYDYAFPPESRFAKMGVHSAGSVWASVQNKHAGPGMCTAGGGALLKLYRATGDPLYLGLMSRIAHFIPQTVSYPERPMYTVQGPALRPSEICERVNLSDWEGAGNVGDAIAGNSVWPTAALMLTWLETPGVYADTETGLVCASDHVNAWLEDGKLMIENPTSFPAVVKVMIESDEDRKKPLGLLWQDRFLRVGVNPGEVVPVTCGTAGE